MTALALDRTVDRRSRTLAAGLTLTVFALAWFRHATFSGRRASTSPSTTSGPWPLIGPDETVMATDEIGPHLSQRDGLLLFPFALAEATPAFPLPAAARRSTPERAAAVDAVVVGSVLHPEQAVAYDAFARSPYLAQFPSVTRYGDVTVYRRTPR